MKNRVEDNSALSPRSRRAGRHGLAARRRNARPAMLAKGAVGLMRNEVLPMKINEVVGLRAHYARESRERNLESSACGPIGRPVNRPTTLMAFKRESPPPAKLIRRSLDGAIPESGKFREVFGERLVRDSPSALPFSQRLATSRFGNPPRPA